MTQYNETKLPSGRSSKKDYCTLFSKIGDAIMPRWPGGLCPHCRVFMPKNLIHCQNCRALLNQDLAFGSIKVPEFIPLREISSMVEIEPSGFYVDCPECRQELRINSKYLSQHVECKFCRKTFFLNLSNEGLHLVAFYTTCPRCTDELRIAVKYMGTKVSCKLCGGYLHLVTQPA